MSEKEAKRIQRDLHRHRANGEARAKMNVMVNFCRAGVDL
jgi:hypothetical protein